MKTRQRRQVTATLNGPGLDQIRLHLGQHPLEFGEESSECRWIRIARHCLFGSYPVRSVRQPCFGHTTTGWVEKPDLQSRLRKCFKKTLVVAGSVIGKVQYLHLLTSASAKQS